MKFGKNTITKTKTKILYQNNTSACLYGKGTVLQIENVH